jgi:two-component system, LytTR family, sensor kinase
MENIPSKPNDLKIRLIGIPLLSFLIAIFLHSLQIAVFQKPFSEKLVITFVNTVFLWEGNRLIFIYFRQKFPYYYQTRQRLVWQTLTNLGYTLFVSAVIDAYLCRVMFGLGTPPPLLTGFYIALVPTICVTMAYESVFFFESLKINLKKTEALARANVQSQLDVLKKQLDPHFLFNSLNTLAALIDEENIPAQTYLDHLSDVYRYVLVSRDKNTVTVEEEMRFLDAYIYLNKARFRDNLLVEKQLSEGAGRRQVAPLSLQLLVENAIKHNVVSREKPLTIRIVEEDGYLAVENNVQIKTTFEQSTKVGLQNIVSRYRLLTAQQVEIQSGTSLFKVRLPLLG